MRISGTLIVVLLILLALSAFSGCGTSEDTSTEPVDTNDPPPVPQLRYPESDASNQSIRPSFKWFCEYNYEGDDVVFRHFIYAADDTLTVFETKTDQDLIHWEGDDLAENAEYFWYVEADDGVNDPVESVLDSFTTGVDVNNPPTVPYQILPPNNSTDVESEDLHLNWQSSFDPDDDPIVYDVYFGEDTHIALEYEGCMESQYNIGALKRDTRYGWYIVARDDQGGSATSPTRYFTTEDANMPPATPSVPDPVDDEPAASLEITLSWTCSDPEGDPLTYDIQFGPPLMELYIATGISETSFELEGPLRNTEYSWSVTAHDDEGGETHGPFWTFTTVNEVYTEIEVTRNISNYYGTVGRSDHMKARFDAAYAPGTPIEPLQPYAVDGGPYSLEWLGGIEPFYFYRDPQNEPFLTLGSTYTFVVSNDAEINYLQVDVEMPDCEQYFTSPDMSTNVSLDGFTVEWYSSCPGTGTVDIYVRDGMGESIQVSVPNSGSYTFSSGQLSPLSGTFELFVDIMTEEWYPIDEVGYYQKSFWRGKVSSTLMLYVM